MRIMMTQDQAVAQFRTFESLAKSAIKDRSVVEAKGDAPGAISDIRPKSTFDFIGHIARSETSKSTNETVRNIFKTTIIKMFGGTDDNDLSCLPDSIRDALKFDDYGKGKPLSARRIRAVMTAVDQVVSERAESVENKLAAQGVTVDDDVKGRIMTAVATCHDDEDAFAALLQNPKDILFGTSVFGSSLRSNSEVAQRVKDLADEVLVHLGTGGDQRLSEVTRPYLDFKDVMPLSKPLLASMVTAVKQLKPADLADFALLKPGVTAQDIQKVAITLDKLLAATIRQTSSRYVKTDGEAQTGYLLLLSSLMLARAFPDKASLRSAQAALASGAASKLKRKCLDSKKTYADLAQTMRGTPGERTMTVFEKAWNRHMEMLDQLKFAVDKTCDGSDSQFQPIEPSLHPVGENELDHTIAGRVGEDVTQMLVDLDHH
ncbi:MAG: hypothetical protein IJJ84_07335 [Kiritimatiellae bacterium]|nr:hypothetical protein [Kiritimatiellia bacterium]